MTDTERDEILKHYHASYISLALPMRQIERETGMSDSWIRRRWNRLGLPNLKSLLTKGSEASKRVYTHKGGGNMEMDDFKTIAPHGAVEGYDGTCIVCSEVHS